MPASWKYFGLRTLNMLLTIFIIAMIMSALYTTLREEDQIESIHRQVMGEVENIDFEDADEAYEYREERIQELKKEHDLDGPRIKRIFYNAADLVTLNLGETHRYTVRGRTQISAIIMYYLPYTILLFTTAAVIYTLLAIAIGLKVAQKGGSTLDKIVTLISATSSSVPVWWAGLLFLMIFTYMLGWYPRTTPLFPSVRKVGYLGYLQELLIKMSLPLFTIVLVKFGGRLLISRNIVSRVLEDDYIMAARAKGVPEKKVIYGHTLRTAAPPIMTTAVLAILTSLGGSLIAEVIFQWPGIGYLLREALHESARYIREPGTGVFEDQLIIGITFVLVVISVVGFYITDILYGLLDPRVEVGSKFRKGEK